MKVIEPGREQQGWSKQYKCTGEGNKGGGCGAQLLVEQDDVFRTQSHARDETTNYATFRCCLCGVWTDIREGELPFTPRAKREEDAAGPIRGRTT